MARISDMHKRWMKEPSYRKAYATLEDEFVLASEVIGVRNRAGLTQEALAREMGTTQPVVARLEAGRGHPSMRTLERLAKATGSRLIIHFAPNDTQSLTTSRRRSRDFMKQLKKNKRPVVARLASIKSGHG
jgi:transcriptional regulator with XRE-family HTH domain